MKDMETLTPIHSNFVKKRWYLDNKSLELPMWAKQVAKIKNNKIVSKYKQPNKENVRLLNLVKECEKQNISFFKKDAYKRLGEDRFKSQLTMQRQCKLKKMQTTKYNNIADIQLNCDVVKCPGNYKSKLCYKVMIDDISYYIIYDEVTKLSKLLLNPRKYGNTNPIPYNGQSVRCNADNL